MTGYFELILHVFQIFLLRKACYINYVSQSQALLAHQHFTFLRGEGKLSIYAYYCFSGGKRDRRYAAISRWRMLSFLVQRWGIRIKQKYLPIGLVPALQRMEGVLQYLRIMQLTDGLT